MPQTRRSPDETVHDFQYRLSEERIRAWQDAPARTGMDRLRRRELAKKAYWTLRGHLQSEHGQRWAPHGALIADLMRLHEEAHA